MFNSCPGDQFHTEKENEKPETTASFPLFIDTLFLALEVFLNHILGLGLLAIILQMDKQFDYFHEQNKSRTEQQIV